MNSRWELKIIYSDYVFEFEFWRTSEQLQDTYLMRFVISICFLEKAQELENHTRWVSTSID